MARATDKLEIEEKVLAAVRHASRVIIAPQPINDMWLDSTYEDAGRRLVLRLNTIIHEQHLGGEAQEIEAVARVPIQHDRAWIIMLATGLMALGICLYATGFQGWAFMTEIAAFWVMSWFVTTTPRYQYSTRKFTVKAEAWDKFPDMSYIYPKSFGHPVRWVKEYTPEEIREW